MLCSTPLSSVYARLFGAAEGMEPAGLGVVVVVVVFAVVSMAESGLGTRYVDRIVEIGC